MERSSIIIKQLNKQHCSCWVVTSRLPLLLLCSVHRNLYPSLWLRHHIRTVISCIDPYPDKALLLLFYPVEGIKLCWHSSVQSALILTAATSTVKAQRESGINTAASGRLGCASVIRVNDMMFMKSRCRNKQEMIS